MTDYINILYPWDTETGSKQIPTKLRAVTCQLENIEWHLIQSCSNWS